MSDNTKIEWADATLNYVNGCTVTSPGCTNCYAMRSGSRNLPHHPSTGLTKPTKAGHVWTGEVRQNEAALLQALKWRKPRRIFWNAHGDLFHPSVPDEWIDRQFAVMALTPQHTHMVLTKRSERMRRYFNGIGPRKPVRAWMMANDQIETQPPFPLPNVWLGVSVEDQTRADERIPDLLATPAAVRFLSCEPLLGPIDLSRRTFPESHYENWLNGTAWDDVNGDLTYDIWQAEHGPKIDWVIVGGESGPNARPMHPDWARSLRDQCAAAGVAFHFKQWGEWKAAPEIDDAGGASFHKFPDGLWMQRIGKKEAGRLLDGVTHDGVPA